MKILTPNSVKGMMIISLFAILLSCVLTVNPTTGAPIQKNQNAVFPNTYEAPTMKDQIPQASYTPPLFSRSLLETDPSKKLRKSEFLDTVKYALYKMTRGEMEQIFYFVDQDKDDTIGQKEWDAFTALFILPFEACDKDGNYRISIEEFEGCWNADPRSKLVTFRRRYEEVKYKLIMDVVSTRGKSEINFADYLFIRKALFGWKQCHSNSKYIAKSNFKCALNAAIPNKYTLHLQVDKIYETGLNLGSTKNLIELDFVGYLQIVYFTYVYTIMGVPTDGFFIDRTQWLKAIKEDRLPNNWEEKEVDLLYQLVNKDPMQKEQPMDFGSFSFFFKFHKLYNKYSIKKPLQLNVEELKNMLNDVFFPKEILMALDISSTKFDEQHYQEASLVLQKLRLNEKDFFFSFKQDASVNTNSANIDATANANYHDITPNATTREVLFSTMAFVDKEYWTKENMYRAFQLANLYVDILDQKTISNVVSATIFIDKLPSFYDTVTPPIGMTLRKNFVIYKALPREIYLDLLTFLALENFTNKLNIQNNSSRQLIGETLLKIVLSDFGMKNMPDTVIDLAQKGYDALRRRQYEPNKIIEYTIVTHAVAAENMRTKANVSTHKLKINNDFSRKFPNFNRKFMSSDKI